MELVLGVALALAVTLVLTVPAPGRADATAGRLAGETRYGTAVAISRATFPAGADIVYLARAVGPLVDALAGGALQDGPILLVPGCGQLPDEVTAEIGRLDPDRVVALGGPIAICDQQLVTAAVAAPRAVADRLAGRTRYGTAVAISRAAFPTGADDVYLARGFDPLVDALAGGSLTDGPVLLVPGCGAVPDEVLAEIDRLGPTRVIALGGSVAICDDLVLAASVGPPDAYRIGGEDRFRTAIAISEITFPAGSDTVYLARAFEPLVDALAGGVLRDGPTLLVPATGPIPPEVLAEIQRLEPDTVMALGGPVAITDEVLDTAAASGAPDDGPSPSPPEPTDGPSPTDGPTASPSPTETETPTETESPTAPSGPVEIIDVVENPQGPDVVFEGGEYLEVRNVSDQPVAMSGWYVLDDDGDRLAWCDITLAPGATARLYTGGGLNAPDHCHAGEARAALDNGGDTLTLHRPDGRVSDVHPYG